MTTVENNLTLQFAITKFGTIRIADSRVTLDSVVYQYKLGAAPEQIVRSFPSLNLVDVYLTIAYYLAHREEVEAYLRQQEADAEAFRQKLESDPEHQRKTAMLRERFRAYKAEKQEQIRPFPEE